MPLQHCGFFLLSSNIWHSMCIGSSDLLVTSPKRTRVCSLASLPQHSLGSAEPYCNPLNPFSLQPPQEVLPHIWHHLARLPFPSTRKFVDLSGGLRGPRRPAPNPALPEVGPRDRRSSWTTPRLSGLHGLLAACSPQYKYLHVLPHSQNRQ